MSERWITPPEIFDPLMAEFDFQLDAAADAETTRIPYHWIGKDTTPHHDSLKWETWPAQRIWLNPPYGRQLAPFVRKALQQAGKGKLVVALIPFRCRAAWWHECVIGRAIEVRCIRKRVRFMRPDGTRGEFTGSCDSCIVVWSGGAHVRETRLRAA